MLLGLKPLTQHEFSADPLASIDFSDQKLERHTRDCYSKKTDVNKTEYGSRVYIIPKKWNTYGLLIKCEVKIAGYWPRSFFASLGSETKSRSINAQKKVSSHLDGTNLVNKGFIIWLSGKFFLQDTAASPERARWLNLNCSGSQPERSIWVILMERVTALARSTWMIWYSWRE